MGMPKLRATLAAAATAGGGTLTTNAGALLPRLDAGGAARDIAPPSSMEDLGDGAKNRARRGEGSGFSASPARGVCFVLIRASSARSESKATFRADSKCSGGLAVTFTDASGRAWSGDGAGACGGILSARTPVPATAALLLTREDGLLGDAAGAATGDGASNPWLSCSCGGGGIPSLSSQNVCFVGEGAALRPARRPNQRMTRLGASVIVSDATRRSSAANAARLAPIATA